MVNNQKAIYCEDKDVYLIIIRPCSVHWGLHPSRYRRYKMGRYPRHSGSGPKPSMGDYQSRWSKNFCVCKTYCQSFQGIYIFTQQTMIRKQPFSLSVMQPSVESSSALSFPGQLRVEHHVADQLR